LVSILNILGNDIVAGIFISTFQVITAEHLPKANLHIHICIYPTRLISSAAIIW